MNETRTPTGYRSSEASHPHTMAAQEPASLLASRKGSEARTVRKRVPAHARLPAQVEAIAVTLSRTRSPRRGTRPQQSADWAAQCPSMGALTGPTSDARDLAAGHNTLRHIGAQTTLYAPIIWYAAPRVLARRAEQPGRRGPKVPDGDASTAAGAQLPAAQLLSRGNIWCCTFTDWGNAQRVAVCSNEGHGRGRDGQPGVVWCGVHVRPAGCDRVTKSTGPVHLWTIAGARVNVWDALHNTKSIRGWRR